MDQFTKVIIQLGSNKGNRLENINQAILGIEKLVSSIKKGSVYVSKAWGKQDQADYYNQIIAFEFRGNAFELLRALLGIEKEMGRERIEKWGPRTIDIDILFFGQQIIWTRELTIPHPYLQDRRFVIEPLNEYWEHWNHPVFKKPLSRIFIESTDELSVQKLIK